MTICLYGSPISTFARKVAIGLDLKGLQYDLVDALVPERREELRKLPGHEESATQQVGPTIGAAVFEKTRVLRRRVAFQDWSGNDA